ncbi:MAG: phosphoglycerate mutase (2,3-diphosphoglycerate-independent) [Pseudomonadales bacterium]|jgi:2,3-bisphosphoglycerate-independent phosphoglycerate mutase|uniref:2,3-bisphosphoglycerate-independent phosphoglycerate mutase n=1 Tax=Halopseudomonas aestusnigri TaxID=857252 RepID=UPI000C4D076C|nr:phosphoglycerate mutase (2,3-diphosphoglycerate-independent) [Pseudomonadales bacterium]HBT58415.1 2,3-bisphosphoglycerate-independent phosphoglycerate mutase [Pseudomonas sp.]MAS67219.1 phosphoglycerate mutase (2,3-diphosphoglycerate-independent) [Pseudomonadales bacterium]MAY08082.1 phosphoglycerate mutase (2,3-diphosphoglycerate-independent) [Pseudomonadales bacterium]MBP75242.1 phosphoglycerate mutase (2,3-diphosphoglycerate-independent) [Pseudomonadales bacterium]|tara:strand:- start:4748 stop:6286 length:1539 start_codon:yes stop_codon:yes gene_type:complete
MTAAPKPVVLMILDGFGYSESPDSNAIMAARTPVWDKLWASAPHTLVSGSGMDVGLPDGQMGNSEVGHMNLGAGRVVYQDFTRVTKSIQDGDFFENPVICGAVDKAVAAGRAVHVMGLLSPGGVHSHEEQLAAMVELAARRGAENIYLHAFLDGRDTPPKSAEASLQMMEDTYARLGKGRTVSLIGRYYAMDRDNRWERVEAAYNLITEGRGEFGAQTAADGLAAAYERGESDEFVKATTIGAPVRVEDGDAVIFMNFRADRARELSRAFVEPGFSGFARQRELKLAGYVMLTQYAADIPAPCAYPPATLENVLGEYLAKQGKTQLRIAETEKYAHVTFFFSGGREEPFEGEERILIPSPQVATYDLQPQMSAPEVTDRIVEAIEQQRYDVIIVNYANGDMVGHTGVFDAAVAAVECLDSCIDRISTALAKVGGEALITADHGNVEQMSDEHTGQAHTAHTCEPVPFVYVGPRQVELRDGGILSDVAPTLLTLLGLPQPAEMTGRSIITSVK